MCTDISDNWQVLHMLRVLALLSKPLPKRWIPSGVLGGKSSFALVPGVSGEVTPLSARFADTEFGSVMVVCTVIWLRPTD